MNKLREFAQIYRLYRVAHSPVYAARIAYDIAFKGMDF